MIRTTSMTSATTLTSPSSVLALTSATSNISDVRQTTIYDFLDATLQQIEGESTMTATDKDRIA